MSVSPARSTALAIVSRVRERGAYAHETADAVLKGNRALDQRDRALATRLAYGTIATAGTLDDILDRFLERPTRLEPRVRDALQIPAWELYFGGADAHVAVNEGVELVRSVRPQAAGLANAVLRKLAAATADFPWGDPAADPNALARLYGHPLWIVERLMDDLGRDRAERVLAADNLPAPVYLAALDRSALGEVLERLAAEGAEPAPGPLAGSIAVGRPSALASSVVLDEGLAIVCDAAAQFAVHALAPAPGLRIVDIGAGRGSKTLLIQAAARAAGGECEIWAVDNHVFKLGVLEGRASQAGLGHIHTLVADATDLPFGHGLPEEGGADAVLVDAPCSGLGTLRRHPDKRWRLEPGRIAELALLSEQLLSQAALLVRAGGFVVYSTCTLTRRENADVIEAFLEGESGRDFRIDDLSMAVPEGWRHFVAGEGWFQSVPEADGPDGHFVARLKRV